MKLIKSQNRLSVINSQYIYHIDIDEEVDNKGRITGNMDIDVYYDYHENSLMKTIATYSTEEECIRNFEKLVDFLGSDSNSGVFEMPQGVF